MIVSGPLTVAAKPFSVTVPLAVLPGMVISDWVGLTRVVSFDWMRMVTGVADSLVSDRPTCRLPRLPMATESNPHDRLAGADATTEMTVESRNTGTEPTRGSRAYGRP